MHIFSKKEKEQENDGRRISDAQMFKKLRRKFVVTSMLCLSIIVAALIAILNLTNFYKIYQRADNTTHILADNGGSFPDQMTDKNSLQQEIRKDEQSDPGTDKNPLPSNSHRLEAPFETRYFYVTTDAGGNQIDANFDHIASVGEEDADAFVEAADARESEVGLVGSFRFRVKEMEDGSVLYIFVDCSSDLANALEFLFLTIIIGLFTMLAMLILVFFFAGRAVAPVVESVEKQRRFISDAGHELKTPLSVISASCDVLELDVGKNEWTQSIHHQVKRMTGLINNLLTLSRMEEDTVHAVFTNFNVSKCAEEMASDAEIVASAAGKTLREDITPDLYMHGDAKAIRQLCSLLLDNAIKYCSEGGMIHIELFAENREIHLEVTNPCDTMPQGNLDRLFDRFYRADSSRNRKTGGYGIGLSVARAIVNSHGGRIEAVRDGDTLIRFRAVLPQIQMPDTTVAGIVEKSGN